MQFKTKAGIVVTACIVIMYALSTVLEPGARVDGDDMDTEAMVAEFRQGTVSADPMSNTALAELGMYVSKPLEGASIRLSAGRLANTTGLAILLHGCGGDADAMFGRPEVRTREILILIGNKYTILAGKAHCEGAAGSWAPVDRCEPIVDHFRRPGCPPGLARV